MGCFLSRSQQVDRPAIGSPTSAAAGPNNAPTTSLGDASTSSGPARHTQLRHRARTPPNQNVNKPLKRLVWTSKDPPWTRKRLDWERDAFFDTRVTGQPEIWQAIHTALQVMWDAEDDNALATAQTIVNAAEITLPHGGFSPGVFDSRGEYYQIPNHIVCDPTNIVLGNMDDNDDTKPGMSVASARLAADEEVEEAARRREEKGKSNINVKEQMVLVARLSENGQDVKVSFAPDEPVSSVLRRIIVESGLIDRRVRLAFSGRVLDMNSSLPDQGWVKGCVVNALVSPKETPAPGS